MSHFIGIVFGNNIDAILEPYDENTVADRYIRFTKEEAIKEVKNQHLETFISAARLLKRHIEGKPLSKFYLKDCFEIIDRGVSISDEEAWNEAKSWGLYIDENENLLSTYNKNSKFDWYSLGGRWGDFLILKDGSLGYSALNKDIDWDKMIEDSKFPLCIVTDEGEWIEQGSNYLCGMKVAIDDRNWEMIIRNYLNTITDDTLVTIIDFHI